MRDDDGPGSPDARIGVRSHNMPANFWSRTLPLAARNSWQARQGLGRPS
jgi:hypothetical protein